MKTALVVLILTLAVVAPYVNCDCTASSCPTGRRCVQVSQGGAKQCKVLRDVDMDCVVAQPINCNLFCDGICRKFSPCKAGLTCQQTVGSLYLWDSSPVYHKGTCQ